MKTFLTISIVLGITILFSCSQEKKPVSEGKSGEEKAVASSTLSKAETKNFLIGEKIFTDNCIKCHGVDGKKKYNGAKDLSISVLSLDERIKIISSAQSISDMFHEPRFVDVLSENEIKEVAEYIVTLRK